MPQKSNASARDIALKALIDVIDKGAYASQAIDRQLSANFLPADDRRLATSLFYTAIENRVKIESVLSPFVKNPPPPEIDAVLHIACSQILFMDRVPDHAAVDEAVKQARNLRHDMSSGFVNGVLRNVIRARDSGKIGVPDDLSADKRLSIEHSVSIDLAKKLISAFGEEEAGRICAYKADVHPQTVRPNLLTTSDEALGTYLHARNVEWEKGIAPHAFNCPRPGAIAFMDGFRKGMYSLQSETSMLAVYALKPEKSMNILDACSAPGGKTALICEIMNGTGRVYAWDVHEHRVELVRAAGKRLKLYNLRPSVRDAKMPLEQFELFMDAVLVDAPCSGLGSMTDKPDIRFKYSIDESNNLVKLQHDILSNCASFVKVGGTLVYSTNTILPEENENQIKKFLIENPQFAPDNDDSWVPDSLKKYFSNGALSIKQHECGMEGAYIAKLKRRLL